MSGADLKREMYDAHGPMMTGAPLRRALGFNTYSAFHRAYENSTVGVPLFSVPGRRGKFALTSDVANWVLINAGIASSCLKNSDADRKEMAMKT